MGFASITGAWIETQFNTLMKSLTDSRPSRARGLKQAITGLALDAVDSRPSRARGLKRLLPYQ